MGRFAFHDRLTSRPNPLHLRKHLQTGLADAEPPASALTMIDIEHGRTINEALGHEVGDLLLSAFASRMTSTVPTDSLVTRQGRDAFTLHVELPNSADPAEAARHIVNDTTATLIKPFGIGAHDLVIGISAGIALVPHRAGDVDSAPRGVVVAKHCAKAGGDDQVVVFESAMRAESDGRLLLERGLRLALECNEFELHDQPLVDRPGRFVGAEALLRWRHPEHGLISPGVLLPIAEEPGLVHAIGREVLRQARLERETWPAACAHAGMSINVSPWQRGARDFVRKTHETANATGINPQRITMEII